jgi:hypothetical protein
MAIAVGGLILALGLALTLFVVAIPKLEESGQIEVNPDDGVFRGIEADEGLADEIAERGPILYSDVASGDRDVFLQHIGDDVDEGWLVFAARPVDAGRDCTLRWDPDGQRFEDPCSDRTFPADGEGLLQYPVEITDGVLVVDLNFEERPAETTTTIQITGAPTTG